MNVCRQILTLLKGQVGYFQFFDVTYFNRNVDAHEEKRVYASLQEMMCVMYVVLCSLRLNLNGDLMQFT